MLYSIDVKRLSMIRLSSDSLISSTAMDWVMESERPAMFESALHKQ